MDSELNLEEKQTYLQTEIVEKGYDTSDFLTYLTSLKGDDGTDINYWTLQELQKVFNNIKLIYQAYLYLYITE